MRVSTNSKPTNIELGRVRLDASAFPYELRGGAERTPAKAAASAITSDGTSLRNVWRSAFRMIASVASRLVDTSPYDDVSEGREVSFVVASNGPLLYRLKRRNPDPPENRGN
jgi:hypothetical protein